ncbi:MAG: hypothetical protein GWO20_17680 [Candidatus Korarchaeota archaeon]|nr:hypothetical protein [Candidatus Korarchaeota archaeon]NIU83815.1 hypothetical protein [Candidatus Thorarchaeota archaeon]NIW15229.1 hypothetical protein [Candidatus Thorarchaeota archaeon]NIW53206.1 hypothetical protein [Candidatus Korarchaeota archaeon]
MKKLLLTTILLIGISTIYSVTLQGSTVESTSTIPQVNVEEGPPILSIVKKVSKQTVKYREKFAISIKIQNNSNSTAYNISIREWTPPPWAFDIIGTLNVSWKLLKPDQEVTHKYHLIPQLKKDQNVSLGKGKVVWYSKGGVRYKGFSEKLKVKIQYSEREGEEWREIWRNSLIAVTIVLSLIIVPLMYIELKTLKAYKETS